MSSFKPYKIGDGVSSIVYHISPGQAAKCARLERSHHIEHERKVLERLGQHPNIIKSFDKQQDGELILEYHPENLQQFLTSDGVAPKWKWAIQVTNAIVHLHSQGVMYRDLDPSNILVTADKDLVLCDFAASSLDGTSVPECGVGTRYYRYDSSGTTTSQDELYALGWLLYELFTPDTFPKDAGQGISEGKVFPATDCLPIGDIILKCWMGDYKTVSEVLSDLKQKNSLFNKCYCNTSKLGVITLSWILLQGRIRLIGTALAYRYRTLTQFIRWGRRLIERALLFIMPGRYFCN